MTLEKLADHLRDIVRIDARSLGLFRLLLGGALLVDWLQRWANRIAFYSNDGVLTNHYHLFQLKTKGRVVWSALHAFSTPGEAAVALAVILFAYVMFTIGWKTRFFHLVSLVGMVSFSARNTLAESPGEALAITLLAVTLFLPLGSRFSVDSILRTAGLAKETRPDQLLDRSTLHTDREVQQSRLPGWSPVSLAALGSIVMIAVVLLSMRAQQTGAAWKDGSALGKALQVHMIATPLGFSLKHSGLMSLLSRVLTVTQLAVPALLFVPALRLVTRSIAALLLLVYGLTYALLTTYSLFGWCFVAAAGLVLSKDLWDRWARRRDPRRALTVIYDVDCGICFWLAKFARRLDTRGHLVLQGNGDFPPSGMEVDPDAEPPARPELLRWDAAGKEVVHAQMPAKIDSAMVENTVVAVRPDGTFATRGAAVAEILRALPGGTLPSLLLRLPGISGLRDRLYDVVATRRTKISVELGLNACGVLQHKKPVPLKEAVAPSTRARRFAVALVRDAFAAILVAAFVIQASQDNPLTKSPITTTKKLEPISWWLRSGGRWDVLAPEPPTVESQLVTDAILKDGVKLDLMTGREAVVDFERPFVLGGQWARFLERVTLEENRHFQDSMRKYFSRRGPRYEPPDTPGATGPATLPGVDAFWLTKPVGSEELTAVRLFRHARGGTVLNPVLAPYIATPRNVRDVVKPETDAEEPEDRKEPLRFPESPGQELE